jgi:Smg protein
MMTFRVLGPHERGRFAPEAWGHLLALTGSGALNAAELEHIIERALLQIDGRIALDDLRSLMEGAGYIDRGDNAQNQTVH